jgi:2-polyprenyl-3-methyl-5-hydroxy-6-metoxy-1,4-benzoquinol methylase
VSADAYDRFMGRFSVPLAHEFSSFAQVGRGERILDVGCGPGALTTQLMGLGAKVAAADAQGPKRVSSRSSSAPRI